MITCRNPIVCVLYFLQCLQNIDFGHVAPSCWIKRQYNTAVDTILCLSHRCILKPNLPWVIYLMSLCLMVKKAYWPHKVESVVVSQRSWLFYYKRKILCVCYRFWKKLHIMRLSFSYRSSVENAQCVLLLCPRQLNLLPIRFHFPRVWKASFQQMFLKGFKSFIHWGNLAIFKSMKGRLFSFFVFSKFGQDSMWEEGAERKFSHGVWVKNV